MMLARCTEPGCVVRFRNGADRPCALHTEDGDNLAARMEAFTELSAVPGAKDGRPSADDGDLSADGPGADAKDGRRRNRHGVPVR